MTFISNKDRVAGVAAMIALANYMKTLPGVTTGDFDGLTPEKLRKECEEAWDGCSPEERDIMLAIWQSTCIPESYYECHLIFFIPDAMQSTIERSRQMLEDIGVEYHFSFSEIAGDEKLGREPHWYLTRSKSNGADLAADMNALTVALESAGIPILRRKIEHIVFDERRDKIAGTGRAA